MNNENNENNEYIKYLELCRVISKGVCGVKIDEKAEFTQGDGVGYQIEGYHNADHKSKRHVIIRSKIDSEYVHPKKLNGKKCFYHSYLREDRQGKLRRYLHLAHRSDDTPYWGSRLVIMSANYGTWISFEKSMREKLRILWVNSHGGYQPDTGEEIEDWCEERWPEFME